MRTACGTILAAAVAVVVTASAETIFEAKGLVTDYGGMSRHIPAEFFVTFEE